jgi:hypothetical protein
VPHPAGRTADLTLHRLARIEQPLGLQIGLHPHARVEEFRLIENEPHRLGLIGGGGCGHGDGMLGECPHRGEQVRTAIADI